MNTTAKTRTANKTHTLEKAAACSENRANRYQSLYTFNPENLKAFDLYSPAMKKAAKESGNSGMSYAKAFWENIAAPDASPRVMNALSVGIDSNGGYTVPEEFHNQLIQAMEEDHPLIGRTHHFSCGHGELKIPIVDKKGEAFWVEELGLIPESAPSFKNHTLGAHKLGREVRISNEFISETSIEWQNFIRDTFARSFAASIEQAMLFGDGDHKLDGMLEGKYPAECGAVSKGSSLAADDLIDLLYSLKAGYQKNAVFIMNDRTYRELRKLKLANGNYLYEEVIDQIPDLDPMLLNHRVIICDLMPDIAPGSKPVLFADLSHYWFSIREPLSFTLLNELYAEHDQRAILGTMRVSGGLVNSEGAKYLQMKS